MCNLEVLKNKLQTRLAIGQKVIHIWRKSQSMCIPAVQHSQKSKYRSSYCPSLTMRGISNVTLLGRLEEIEEIFVENTENGQIPAILLKVSTFSFQTDNKFVSLPSLSKDVHKVLVYGENPALHVEHLIKSSQIDFAGLSSIKSAQLEYENLFIRLKGSLGLHSSYVAKYKKKICEPTIHVSLPDDSVQAI